MSQKTYGADITSAPARVLGGADAAARAKRTAGKKSQLRGVYLRPEGTDADAKLVLVDKKNRPKYAQG